MNSSTDVNIQELITARDLLCGWNSARPICRIQSLLLERGKTTVLCGPNGAGKSTLLKTLAAQITPLEGEISIDGMKMNEMDRKSIAKKLAYVAQFSESRKNMTVEEFVFLGRNPHQDWWSWSQNKEDKKKVERALERTTCQDLRGSFLDNLSGGERQRVAIAAALAQDPHYILMDEPTAHLDFHHQLELMELLEQLQKEKIGILVALHDLNLAAKAADQIILLKKTKGKESTVAAQGLVNEVFTAEILADVYDVEVKIVQDNGTSNFIPISLRRQS